MNTDTAETRRGAVRLLHGDLTERIIGTFYQVHYELGAGFLESVYESAMAIALQEARIPFERQHPLQVHFRGRIAGEFRVDLLVDRRVIVELKVCRTLAAVHEAQLMNYLRASWIEVGLLLNFRPHPEFRRIVYANERKLPGPNDGSEPRTTRSDADPVRSA